MSTEITKAPEPKAIIRATDRGLVLTTLEDMWRAASAFHKSGLFVKTHDTVEKTFVAMQCGAEVGLAPIQSLMSVAVINGRPTMWGDALPGLVWASGLCDGIEEHIEGSGDSRTAVCVARRKGVEPATRRFSMSDAKRAGLLGKGTWSQYPDRMLQMRARAFALRDAFADVLKGIQVREEVQDYDLPDVTANGEQKRLTAIPDQLPDEPTEVERSDLPLTGNGTFQSFQRRIEMCVLKADAARIAQDIGSAIGPELTQEEADELVAQLGNWD